MHEHEHWKILEHVIHLNDGKLVGKTRLQKTVYLLQAAGIDLGFDFEYHYYGPYSEEISENMEFSEYSGHLTVDEEFGYNSVPYTVFSLKEPPGIDEDKERDNSIRHVLEFLKDCPTVVLELTATLHFLEHDGYADQAEKELRLRKSTKASPERIEKAKKLLSDIRIH